MSMSKERRGSLVVEGEELLSPGWAGGGVALPLCIISAQSEEVMVQFLASETTLSTAKRTAVLVWEIVGTSEFWAVAKVTVGPLMEDTETVKPSLESSWMVCSDIAKTTACSSQMHCLVVAISRSLAQGDMSQLRDLFW